MTEFKDLDHKKVLEFFGQISSVPRGSEDTERIADFCCDFAKRRELRYVRDSADNVIIYKNGTFGLENAKPVILQGHLDMVCQKREDCDIDFKTQGIDLQLSEEFITANGTSLGADNGIAVAMVMSILDSDNIKHPPIEAVFTSNEEIGMVGALQLDMGLLKSKRMINLDSEDDSTLTVSCAGGSDFKISIQISREEKETAKLTVFFRGLLGGHSGVEIDKCRVNSDILAGRFINHMRRVCEFDLISVSGGDKPNAIPCASVIELAVSDGKQFILKAEEYLSVLKSEISAAEPDFYWEFNLDAKANCRVLDKLSFKKVNFALSCMPQGIMSMSAEIEGLVETSLNLGILSTLEDEVIMHFALRSNKASALSALEEKLKAFCGIMGAEYSAFGHYPAWEYLENSRLRKLYSEIYLEKTEEKVKVEAIHAGLECGVFAGGIEGLDCIAIGPTIYDVHTANEKLSLASTFKIYDLLKELLSRLEY